MGLFWKEEYADPETFEAAIRALPIAQRDKAWEVHLNDPRDKATPVGMVEFLNKLMLGQLLSNSATGKLLSIMAQTATGKDRLEAGVPSGWKVAHKTGTGRYWNGVTETTNDVGILTAPDGTNIPVAVFLAGSKSSADDQASTIARVAQSISNWYRVSN
jgi:beta-lactamase class A